MQSETQPIPTEGLNDNDDDWERRRRHRLGGYMAVLQSADYMFVLSCGAAGSEPDPTDRAVSKRAWEESMKAWRRELAALRQNIERQEVGAAALGRGAADISAALSAGAVPDRVQEVIDAIQSADHPATSERTA
jgi:hypothetical protein